MPEIFFDTMHCICPQLVKFHPPAEALGRGRGSKNCDIPEFVVLAIQANMTVIRPTKRPPCCIHCPDIAQRMVDTVLAVNLPDGTTRIELAQRWGYATERDAKRAQALALAEPLDKEPVEGVPKGNASFVHSRNDPAVNIALGVADFGLVAGSKLEHEQGRAVEAEDLGGIHTCRRSCPPVASASRSP